MFCRFLQTFSNFPIFFQLFTFLTSFIPQDYVTVSSSFYLSKCILLMYHTKYYYKPSVATEHKYYSFYGSGIQEMLGSEVFYMIADTFLTGLLSSESQSKLQNLLKNHSDGCYCEDSVSLSFSVEHIKTSTHELLAIIR